MIIAAIKAGRIDDFIRHSSKQYKPAEPEPASPPDKAATAKPTREGSSATRNNKYAGVSAAGCFAQQAKQSPFRPAAESPGNARNGKSEPLNLDDVIAEYMKRRSEQGRLDLNVVSPGAFTAGKSINLKVKILYGTKPEAEATVTIKIVGTAFKPQVYIGHAGHDGIAAFNLTLPSFTAGTAAIVIEAHSIHGRGELKHLIRRA